MKKLAILSVALCSTVLSAVAGEPEKVTNSIGMELVQIPAGKFLMGQALGDAWQKGGEWDEVPVHEVTLSNPFWMGVTEVTNEQYEQFDPGHKKQRGVNGFSKAANDPVLQVSYEDALAFCKWLSEKEGKPYRLPTEAEWEYACRAGTTTPYSTGETLPEEYHRNQANFDDHKTSHSKPVLLGVGRSPANPWGLHDMHGNAEEWCLDWYGPYPEGAVVDPVGRAEGISRVTRGGSHNTDVYYLRSANRMSALPTERNYLIGFRVVQAPMPAGVPLSPEPAPLSMTNVSQETPLAKSYSSIKPLFTGPTPFVVLPDQPQGPIFSFHNHDPALVDCPNGDLLAVWYTTQREWGPELNVVASRLRAGSETWEPASLFFDLADRNEHAPALWRDKDTIYHFNGLGISGWGGMATILRTSKDNGATWTSPRVIKSERRPPSGCVESVIKTSSGKILLPLDGPGLSTELLVSADEGETWTNPTAGRSLPEEIVENGSGPAIAGIHAAVVELRNGDWYSIGRGKSINNRSTISLSKDQGQTWTYSQSDLPPTGTGQRPLLLRLREGPLLFIGFTDTMRSQGEFKLGFERERTLKEDGMEITDAAGVKRKVHGMFAALSFDEGKTWPVRRLLSPGGPAKEYYGHGWTKKFTVDENHAEPLGYPSIAQSDDGRIHLISSGLYYAFNFAWLQERMPAEKKF